MEGKLKLDQIKRWCGKYKYAGAILLLGLLLMNFPASKEEPVATPVITQEDRGIAEDLKRILSQIEGVGRVEVMITELTGPETVYQADLEENEGDGSSSSRIKTVLYSKGNGEEGLVKTVLPASYRGAVIVCEGGDDPAVSLAVVQAVSKVTGISSDRIAVLKMK